MADPRYTGAQQRLAQQWQQSIERWCEEVAWWEVEQEAAAALHEEMLQAIATATPLLERFLREQRATIQDLLGATDPVHGRTIYFGSEERHGTFIAVYLNKNGLQQEVMGVQPGSGNFKPRPASPQQAVEAYAYHGWGYENPQRVRDIVDWLIERVDKSLLG